MLALLLVALAACTSDDAPATPTVTATADGTGTAEPTASPAPQPVGPASLELPEGCLLFDEGFWQIPAKAGQPLRIELRAATCARSALARVAALLVAWTPFGLDGPTVTATLTPSTERRWAATVTFPEPGSWHADPVLGGASFLDVFPSDDGLVSPHPGLPLPAAPREVAVLDGSTSEVLRRFSSDFGGVGLLRDPGRVAFALPHGSGARIVAGDVATGAIEPLLEVSSFPLVYSAPDGNAVAIDWGEPGEDRRHLAVVDAATGSVTEIADGSPSALRVAWAPDSGTLLAAGASLWVLEPDGQVREQRPLTAGEAPWLWWAPDSSYALLRFFGERTRIVRLDASSLREEVVFDERAGVRLQTLTSLAIAPSSERVAVAWSREFGDPVQISVARAEELVGVSVEDHVVATIEPDGDSPFQELGGLSWSPDERWLAFTAHGFPIGGEPAPRPGSVLGLIEVGTGAVRRLIASEQFYSTNVGLPAWSADGRTLFALRFPCTACGPGTSGVDAVDARTGGLLEAHDDSWYVGPAEAGASQLLITPGGLLRTNGRGERELLVRAPGGGAAFGSGLAALDDGSLLATQIGSRGSQLLVAAPDGAGIEVLAVLPGKPVALLGAETAIVRREGVWARYNVADGTVEPYAASGTAPEKVDFAPSPSGRLALDLDREGFAVLDAAAPAGPAVVARRDYPGGAAGGGAWSTDERRLAFGGEHAIGVFDIESGAERAFELGSLGVGLGDEEPRDRLWALVWTPDGALAFATPGALWRLDPESGAAARAAEAPRPGAFTQGTVLAYSPDGLRLAAATQFGVFVLEDGNWRQLAQLGVPVIGGSLAWAPDGSAVAYSAAAGFAHEGVVVVPLDGSGAYRLVAPPRAVTVLEWLPDGRIAWVSTPLGE
jgi:hypothetical protein